MAVKRIPISRELKYKDQVEINGWDVRFEYAFIEGANPSTVNVSATKGSNQYFSLSFVDQNINASFNNSSYDIVLVSEVINEVNEIQNGSFDEE